MLPNKLAHPAGPAPTTSSLERNTWAASSSIAAIANARTDPVLELR